MSTENCKKFIEEISIAENLPLKTTWKRTENYKEKKLTFRKFENKEGDEILLSENEEGMVQLVELNRNVILPADIKPLYSSQKLFTEFYKIGLDLSIHNEDIELDSFEPLSKEAIRKYMLIGNDTLISNELKDYQPSQKTDIHIGYYVMYSLSYEKPDKLEKFKDNFINDTSSDNVGINYDKENMLLYYVEKEGISFFKAICGGDWEVPIHFLVYWSEKDNRLKGFFPEGDANIYNMDYKCAYGSEEETSTESQFPNRAAYDKAMNEVAKERDDIDIHYSKLSDRALNKAFKELKSIILKDNLIQKHQP